MVTRVRCDLAANRRRRDSMGENDQDVPQAPRKLSGAVCAGKVSSRAGKRRLAGAAGLLYVRYRTKPGPADRRVWDRRMAPAARGFRSMKSATTPPFDPLQFLARVGKGKTLVKVPARGEVFAQGDPADAVFYIQKGRIELRVASARGKEAVLAHLTVGDFFGEGCLSGQPLRLASAVAVVDSSAIRIGKPAMIEVLRDQPAFSSLFVAYLLKRNSGIEADLVDQLFNSSEKRLARLLLQLSHFGKDADPEVVLPGINQETLAAMIGTTRSRVSFFMNKFRKLGFIKYDGHNGPLEINRSLLSVILQD
jgi:CRP/FNR family transcriptional regulator, cyclic AMP receptor protein